MIALTDAVILVGGLGTRLHSLTRDCPKPLLPVGGKPFLDVLLWQLKRFGFGKVIFSAGHLAHQVQAYAERAREQFGLDVVVVTETEPLGTAGAIRNALPVVGDRFLVMNGDSLFDFNVLDLVTLLDERTNLAVAMSLRRLDDASRFGVVDREGERVTGFRERGDCHGGVVNAGVYLIDKKNLPDLPESGSLERDVLPVWARSQIVCGRVYDGFFLDIGVPEAYALADTLVPANARRSAVFFDRDGVINVDYGYVGTIDRFHWVEGAIDAVKHVNDTGRLAFLITNQAGVARGYYGEEEVAKLHSYVQSELRSRGAHFDDIRYCPHHLQGIKAHYAQECDWRKPKPGMIIDIMKHWSVEKTTSFVIGDRNSDVEAARSAAMAGFLFQGGNLEKFLKEQEDLMGVKTS